MRYGPGTIFYKFLLLNWNYKMNKKMPYIKYVALGHTCVAPRNTCSEKETESAAESKSCCCKLLSLSYSLSRVTVCNAFVTEQDKI